MYELGLGEFSLDPYDASGDEPDCKALEPHNLSYIYLLFMLSSLILMILLMNMLIGIMSEILAEEREQEDNRRRSANLEIMGEYSSMINKDNEL